MDARWITKTLLGVFAIGAAFYADAAGLSLSQGLHDLLLVLGGVLVNMPEKK